jgi:hypothetical protein
MSKLWIPPSVSDEHRDGTRQFNAELEQCFDFRTPVCAQWNPELALLDPYLKLAKAHPNVVNPAVKPGFYHLIRICPDVPWWVQPLANPVDGSFVEPSSQMLDMLRSNDLQNARVVVDREVRLAQARMEKDRERERDRLERQEEAIERWNAVSRAQVSMNRDTPWTQNASGRRRKAA